MDKRCINSIIIITIIVDILLNIVLCTGVETERRRRELL